MVGKNEKLACIGGGFRGGAGGAGLLIFRSNWGPMGRKKFFLARAPPLISGSGWPAPPLISGSGWLAPPPPPYLRVWMTGPPLSEGLGPPLCMTFLCLIALRKNKTVAHTFLPSFDNANGRLCQVKLLWSRNFATLVTWRHTIVKKFRNWSWRKFNTESLFLNSRYNRDRRNVELLAEKPGSTLVHVIKEF